MSLSDIKELLQNREFIWNSFYMHLFRNNVDHPSLQKILGLMYDCAAELLSVVHEATGYRQLPDVYAAACLLIAIKFIGHRDWVEDKALVYNLVKFYPSKIKRNELLQLEGKILQKTDWQGCVSIAALDKIYDELFKDDMSDESESDESDSYSSSSKDSSYSYSSASEDEEKKPMTFRHYDTGRSEENTEDTQAFLVRYEDGVWYLKSKKTGQLHVSSEIAPLKLQKAVILLSGHLTESIAKSRGISYQEAEQWITEQILKDDFAIGYPIVVSEEEMLLMQQWLDSQRAAEEKSESGHEEDSGHDDHEELFTLRYMNERWFLESEDGAYHTQDDIIRMEVRKARVLVNHDLIEETMDDRRPDHKAVMDWLYERVLKHHFALEDVKIEEVEHIPDDTPYQSRHHEPWGTEL
jgi:hypothetical protein